MSLTLELGVLLALTLVNAFFAGAEIAVLSVRTSRLRELVEEGSRAAQHVLALRNDPERFLATVQIGITVVGAAAGAFGGAVLEQPVAGALRVAGLHHGADEVALTLVVVVVSSLSVVLGELVPKSLALRSAEFYSLRVAGPLLWLSRVAKPAVWALTKTSNAVLRPFGDRTTFTEARLSPDELQHLVEEAAAAGSLDARAGEIASRAIDLGGLAVSAVMVPRMAIASLPPTADSACARELLRSQPHARYPVMDAGGEQVAGYVMARDVYEQLLESRFDLGKALRTMPVFVEGTPAVEVLRRLQAARTQIAVIVDERGTIAGLVSVEDIAEELLGDILEEHESPVRLIEEEGPATYLVQGSTPLHEVNRELGTDLPSEAGATTIAGLVIQKAGAIPKRGEHVELSRLVTAEIVDATVQRVRILRVHVRPGTSSHPGAPATR